MLGNAGSSETVEKVEECTARGAGGEPFVVDLDETDRGVPADGRGTVPDVFIVGGLHGRCFESRDSLFTKNYSHGVCKGRRMWS